MDYKKVDLTCEPLLVGYQIDTEGNLYSKRGKRMKPSKNHKGYLIESFSIDGKMKSFSVHSLVARQFIPNNKNKPTVNHINGIKTDNRVDNLEWATMAEQAFHSRNVLGNTCDYLKKKVIGKKIGKNEYVKFSSIVEAAKTIGVSKSSVWAAVSGRKKSSNGYVFVVAETIDPTTEKTLKEKEDRVPYTRNVRIGQFDDECNLVRVFTTAYSTRNENFIPQCVELCCKGKRKTHRGYYWKYIDIAEIGELA